MNKMRGSELGLFSVFDKISNIYDTPFFARDDVFAKRRFLMWCNEKESMLGQFHFDFELHRIGQFNTFDGKLEMCIEPIVIIEGDQIINNERKEGE